jgi:hypothetical protein
MKYRIITQALGDHYCLFFPQIWIVLGWRNMKNHDDPELQYGSKTRADAESRIEQHKRNRKFRILQIRNRFFAQKKRFGMWWALYRQFSYTLLIFDVSEAVYYMQEDHARQAIDQYIENNGRSKKKVIPYA